MVEFSVSPAGQIVNYILPCFSMSIQNICITFIQRLPNVIDVGPTLYKCYTNVSCLLGEYPECSTLLYDNGVLHHEPRLLSPSNNTIVYSRYAHMHCAYIIAL